MKLTKQERYSEIQEVEEFVEKLPEYMSDAVKVLTADDIQLIAEIRELLGRIDDLKTLQENVETGAE